MLVSEVRSPVTAIAFSRESGLPYAGTKDGRLVVIMHDGTAETFQTLNGSTIGEMKIPWPENVVITSIVPHADGRLLVATNQGHGVIHPYSEQVSRNLYWVIYTAGATSIAVVNEHTMAVSEGVTGRPSPGTVVMYNISASNPEPLRKLTPEHKEPKGVPCVTAHEAASLLAWATGHQKIMVWNPRQQDPIAIPLRHTACSIAFHPDGTRLAIAQEWNASLIDIAKKYEVTKFTGHKGRVTSVAFRPDGRVLATGSWDGTVRLWDVATGQVINSLTSPVGRVFTIAYDAEGARLAAGGDAGNVVIWDVD